MSFLDRVKQAAQARVTGARDAARDGGAAREERLRTLPDPGDQPLAELPLTPESRRIGEEEKARIAAGLDVVAADGVDVDDLQSISNGLDRALAAWVSAGAGKKIVGDSEASGNGGASEASSDGHDDIVERYAMAIGEHLHRHTDLAWEVVTDVFGTDLAVAAGDFVVVPGNLVAVRWMRRETGWVPKVVGHLVTLRTR